MADKRSKREYFEELKGLVVDNEELIVFLDKEIGAIDKRNEKAKEKRAEKAAEGDALQEAVKNFVLEADHYVTAEEVAEALVEDFPEVTKAKVTYRATQLVKAGEIGKDTIKDAEGRKVVAYTDPTGDVEVAE